MLIDWFTVGAQALNFLLLVWLLRRYLYKPVLAAIEAREKKVAARIADAATQEKKAQLANDDVRRRNEAFAQERDGLMRKAAQEGATERQRLIDSARQEAQLLRVKLAQALGAERAELGRQLSLRTRAEVFALTRKALSELAGTNLEDRMAEVFIDRLRALPRPAAATAEAVSAGVALVRSAHDPAAGERVKLEAAIRERFGANVAVRFETAPEFVGGLELSMDGVKLAWSVADYLSTLAQDAAAIATTELAHAD